MADKTEKTDKTPKPITYTEAKKAYDALAKQCSENAAKLPKLRREIEAEVEKKFGDVQAGFKALQAKKLDASREMYAAAAREGVTI